MFLDFYKLREQPFGETPDPHYIYLSETHCEALASLFYGIQTGRGFLALIAEPGMGKTTVLFHLLDALRSSARTAFLFQTQCNSRELLGYLLADLGIDAQAKDRAWMHEQLKEVLIAEASAGRRVVVFIDEAQNLTESALETTRLLSDFENPCSKLIQIVLAGQPRLADKLARPSLTQLRQRISILSRLNRFTPEETDAFIKHRLEVAGYEGRQLFTPEARAMIAVRSEGIPRNINSLCFNALTLGYALGRKVIDGSLVQEAADDLEVNALVSKQHDSQRHPEPLAAISQDAPVPPRRASGKSEADRMAFRAPALAALIFLAAVSCILFVGLRQTGVPTRLGPEKSSGPAPLAVKAIEAEHGDFVRSERSRQARVRASQSVQALPLIVTKTMPQRLAVGRDDGPEREMFAPLPLSARPPLSRLSPDTPIRMSQVVEPAKPPLR